MNDFLTTEQVKLSWKGEGWIMWRGGKCPVDENTFIERRYPGDKEIWKGTARAGEVNWNDCIAYRLHNGPGYRDGIAIEQKADEWVDGQPPVGEVCEISPGKSGLWTEYKVLAYYGIHAWIVEAGSLDPGTCLVGSCKFRPIQSQRDKVIEAAIFKVRAHNWTYLEVIESLYDAGMLSMPEGDK